MTFGEACRQLRSAGCTNLWDLSLFDRKPPVSMTEQYIANNELRGAEHGEWDVSVAYEIIFVRHVDGSRLKVYVGA